MLEPSRGQVFRTCEALVDNVQGAMIRKNGFVRLFPTLFNSISPSEHFDYNGWSSTLVEVSAEMVEAGQDPGLVMDPGGVAPVVGLTSSNIQLVHEKLPAYGNLVPAKERLLNMAGFWGIHGDRAGSNSVDEVLSILSNAIEPFESSTMSLIFDLDRSSVYRPPALQFAQQIDE